MRNGLNNKLIEKVSNLIYFPRTLNFFITNLRIIRKLKKISLICNYNKMIKRYFIGKEKQLLPIDGNCPKCDQHLMWGQFYVLIKNNSTINKKKRDKPAIENDILFGQKSHGTTTAEAKNSRKKRKTTTSNSESATSMLPLGGGGVVAPNQKQKEALIESISFQKLAKGTKLLGIVREINDKFARPAACG